MKREHSFFKTGLFEKPFMNSRIQSEQMSMKEKILGFLVGPFGTLAFLAIVNQLAELYYTEIFYIDQIFGVGTYLVLSYITRIVSMICGFAAAYVAEHSVSSQGRIRPLVLIGALISAVSGVCMFWIPDMPDTAKLIWVAVAMFLYNGVGGALFGMRGNLLTLSTRNQDDRSQINLINQITSYLLVGTAVTLVVGSVLYYSFLHGHPMQNWVILIVPVAILSIPLSFVQYFFTIERITLENRNSEDAALEEKAIDFTEENRKSLWTQIKALLHCKYWMLALAINTLISVVYSLSGYNLSTNFCTVVLGATAENNVNLFYTIVSGLPLGIGVLFLYPLCKKFTIRKTTICFAFFSIAGCVLGLMVKSSIAGAIAANFIFSLGSIPTVYIIAALTNAANDEVEYKFGFRPEGTLSAGVIGCATSLLSNAFAGVYETGLSAFGYDAAAGSAQPDGVVNWIMFIRYVVPLIEYALLIVLLFLMNIEEKLPQMNEEIEKRHLSK